MISTIERNDSDNKYLCSLKLILAIYWVIILSLEETLILLFVPLIIVTLLYYLGRGPTRRETGRTPFASGHKYPSVRPPYRPWWLYFISFFILWDIVLIFVLFMTSMVHVIFVLIFLAVVVALFPIGARRRVKK